jgi:acetyltransferase-like isoleucine patch superfamily enzyme
MIRHYGWIHAINHREEPSSPKIVIKAHTSIGMGVTISAVRRIVLEAHVLLARNVYISDHGHGFEDINTPIMFQGVRAIGEVSIGEHTWIGQNACVMPGVQIGRHCVIGANSVVTRDLPDYCVAVGSPARIIKQYNEKSKRWEKVSGRTQSVE